MCVCVCVCVCVTLAVFRRHNSEIVVFSTQVGEVTAHLPVTQTRSYNLYVVAEDCAPPKDNEGILFVHKGQIYDVIENKSDWWWARLVRDLTTLSENICQQGWVPGSFLEKYEGSLTADEQTNINTSEILNMLGYISIVKTMALLLRVAIGNP